MDKTYLLRKLIGLRDTLQQSEARIKSSPPMTAIPAAFRMAKETLDEVSKLVDELKKDVLIVDAEEAKEQQPSKETGQNDEENETRKEDAKQE